MQLSTKNNPVERIGDTGEETQFSITTNAQAFEILSAGIYTDPIMAVIRELSCNAYDAMVEAGKGDEPFTLCLPNKMSPSFSVIDNGIGLSDKDLRGMYTSYFTSTKTGTNKQIGAFGLGSKSPFSYAKAFEVISRFDGEKRTYSIFLNEDGVPTMSEMANVLTDEGNGIEVKLAIRSEDHYAFSDKTREILQYFPVRPTIKGQVGFQWPEVSSTATVTDNYTIDSNGSGLVAIQGNVPYHVNKYQVESIMSDSCQRFMNNHRIALRFDIGMLDVAVSREEVRYEERTKQNIADAVQSTFDDYLEKLDEELSELTKTGSKWEIYSTLRKKFGSRYGLEQLVGSKFKFKSNLANAWLQSDSIEFDMDWKYHKVLGYQRGNIRATRAHVSINHRADPLQYTIVPSNGTQVVLQDVTKRGSLRMNTKLGSSYSNDRINSIIALVPITDNALAKDGKTATAAQRKAELKKIQKQMGNPNIETLSEWTEDVAPAARASRASGHAFKTLNRYNRSSGRSNSKPQFTIGNQPADGGIYLEIDQYRNIGINGIYVHMSGSDLQKMLIPVINIINISKGTEYSITDVYGLTKTVAKHVSTDDDWTLVDVLYKEAIEDQKDIVEYYSRIGSSDTLDLSTNITKSGFINVIADLPVSSPFKKLMEPVLEVSKDAVRLSNHKTYPVTSHQFRAELKYFESHFGIKVEVDDTSFFNKTDIERYPMLRHISFGYGEDAKDALQYIQLVESK